MFARLCCAVFSLDSEPFEDFLESSFAEDRVRHWMAFAGARPVATAMTVHVGDRFAWIGWVATIPEFRGMGIQSALARRQIEACAEEGIERVSLEAAAPTRHGGGTSLRNYQRLGWRSVHQRIVYLRRAS